MKKTLASLLTLLLLLSLLPILPFTAEEAPVRVLACSDFQHPSGNSAGAALVSSIVSTIISDGVTSVDGFLCCGDYDHDLTYGISETSSGVNALKGAVSPLVSENMVFVQGNHDSGIGTAGMSPSGDNDPASGAYGVFVINEDDYMWNNTSGETVKRTAQRLIEYLNDKLAEGFDRPIFVCSHLPLHYSMRTKNDGDGMYAGYLFDALNAAGSQGLNIVYLFGHDHSNGWDDYLGGAQVCLLPGDPINIAHESRTAFTAETLRFTYMNAGYTGYYENHNGASEALSMTVFTIEGSSLSISRYGTAGVLDLKTAGVRNAYKSESGYSPDTRVIPSPESLSLTAVTDPTPIPDLLESGGESAGRLYTRVTSASQLVDGGRYLLVYNSDIDYIMLPESVRKANSSGSYRVGMNIEEMLLAGGNFGGDFSEKEWLFRSTEGGWLLSPAEGEESGALTFTSTSSTGVTATFAGGSPLTIGGSADRFTFKSGGYYLNYNARGLINGFDSNPAEFYIYTVTDCDRTYERVTELSELREGDRYVFITQSNCEGVEALMLPVSVSKTSSSTRIGFDLEECDLAKYDTVHLDDASRDWKLTAYNGGWRLSPADGEGYAKLTSTSSNGITATFDPTGNRFLIAGSADNFTFTSGSYVLNYNARGLINGYERTPVGFAIYRYLPAYAMGDVNADGLLSIQDISALLQAIADETVSDVVDRADLNGDGSVTVQDVTALLVLLADR